MSAKRKKILCWYCKNLATHTHPHVMGPSELSCDSHKCDRCQPIKIDKYAHKVRNTS